MYQNYVSILVNLIMLFTYTREVKENFTIVVITNFDGIGDFLKTPLLLQILGYIQMILAFITLFFWMMIEYPLICQSKWKEL